MPTDKNKKEVKVRDLKPSKDAKGGAARSLNAGGRSVNAGAGRGADMGGGRSADRGSNPGAN